MNILIGTVLLWGAAALLWRRLPEPEDRVAALEGTWSTLCFTVPRVVVALLGAAFFAELLPADKMESLFGAEAGVKAVLLAVALGPFTPGGAFVAFAIGAAALQSGAAMVPVLAYIVSWSLFALTKILAYEIPFMRTGFMWRRLVLSLPVPFVIAAFAWVILQ